VELKKSPDSMLADDDDFFLIMIGAQSKLHCVKNKVFYGIPPHPLELADHSIVYQEYFIISVVDMTYCSNNEV
jgi:hypothetical protein